MLQSLNILLLQQTFGTIWLLDFVVHELLGSVTCADMVALCDDACIVVYVKLLATW